MTNWCINVSSVKPGWDKVAKSLDKDNNNELCYSEMPKGIDEYEFKGFLDTIKKAPPRALLGRFHFFSGKSKSISLKNLNKAYQIAAAFKKDPRYKNAKLIVECHTDSTGDTKENLKISQLRAELIAQRIFFKGILPSGKIEPIGYGPTRPIVPNNTAANRAANNRTEFIILVDTVYKR